MGKWSEITLLIGVISLAITPFNNWILGRIPCTSKRCIPWGERTPRKTLESWWYWRLGGPKLGDCVAEKQSLKSRLVGL